VITLAIQGLRSAGQILVLERDQTRWYTLPSVAKAKIDSRLAELESIHRALASYSLTMRIGQALEIATYRALASTDALEVLGGFLDLDQHGDDTLYKRQEPPRLWRRNVYREGILDFIVADKNTNIAAGIEVKNIRKWIYPEQQEIKDLLKKCCALDLIPILVARRIHFTTTRLLIPRGGLVHETYNQRIPEADAQLAQRAQSKHLLGYHDIRLGNQPDARMLRFAEVLPSLFPGARSRFEAGGREELDAFANGHATLASLGLGI
jgi:hypothetical protein